MKIKLVNKGTEAELFLEGRLDSQNADEFEEIINNVSERFATVVLNMEKMDYVSSAGLRIIKMTHMNMKKKNGELVLKKVNKMVMEVFEMTGLAGLLRFVS